MNIVFLCSGGGGNLRFIHAANRESDLIDLRITGVFGDRSGPAIDFAAGHGIVHGIARFDGHDDNEICASIESCSPDVIVTNIHRILSPNIVAAHRGRLLNLHYSLLPSFGGLIGMEPVRRAIDAGCRFVGTTVHHVVEEVDAGPIVSQSLVEIVDHEPFDRLADRVFRSGCLNLLNAIRLVSQPDRAPEPTGHGLPSPCAAIIPDMVMDDDLWDEVRG